MPVGLGCVEGLDDALVVRLNDVLGDAFHSEDLDVQPLSVGERILDTIKTLLVNLVHVDRETCTFENVSTVASMREKA